MLFPGLNFDNGLICFSFLELNLGIDIAVGSTKSDLSLG